MKSVSKESIYSFDDLKSFVYRTICHDYNLLVDAHSTTESILKRGNSEPCCILFCITGPRSVQFSAVWENEQNCVFFYNHDGRRYREIRLLNNEFEFAQPTPLNT